MHVVVYERMFISDQEIDDGEIGLEQTYHSHVVDRASVLTGMKWMLHSAQVNYSQQSAETITMNASSLKVFNGNLSVYYSNKKKSKRREWVTICKGKKDK